MESSSKESTYVRPVIIKHKQSLNLRLWSKNTSGQTRTVSPLSMDTRFFHFTGDTIRKTVFNTLANTDKQRLHQNENTLGQATSDRLLIIDPKTSYLKEEKPGEMTFDGPAFGDTNSIFPIEDTIGREISLNIVAKVTEGFFKAGRDWTCYRRNYFGIESTLRMSPIPVSRVTLTNNRTNTRGCIIKYALSLTGHINDDNAKEVKIIQHKPEVSRPINVPEAIGIEPPTLSTSPLPYDFTPCNT